MSVVTKLAALAVLGGSAFASAAAITSGNLVVYRVGDGSAALSNASTAVFLDEYTPAGVLVQSIALPTTAGTALTASGTASSEGLITVSPDGKYLSLTGYSAAPGTASINGTASATTPRTVGVLDTTSTTNAVSYTFLTDAATGNNIRSAVTTNGTDLYVAGAAGGVRYATAGSTTSTQLSTTLTNLRQINIVGGQLYTTTSSGTAVRLGTVGSGTPTTSGQTITNLPGFPASTGSPYGFFFADLDGTAGVDTVYVADDTTTTGGIQKYSLVGGSWTLNNTIVGNSIRGLTGVQTATGVTLYASGNGNTLYSLTDTAGFNANDNGALTSIATAATNTAFRGIVAVVPEPTSLAALGLIGAAALRRRRA
jgi:hypothetical protein